jgi:hypothetical protein
MRTADFDSRMACPLCNPEASTLLIRLDYLIFRNHPTVMLSE